MFMKFKPRLGLLAAALALSAQTATADPAAQPAGEAAAREALGKKEGDVDQTELLKSTLTSVDKSYSLIKRGNYLLNYNLNYAYIGQETIDTDGATLFRITNTNSHTITNSFSLDYGLRNDLTVNLTLPIVTKVVQESVQNLSGTSNMIGDISLGARYQPYGVQRDLPSLTLTAGLRLPTGTSPFEVVSGSGLSTGSGGFALSAGVSVNKIVDPVALFGSMNVTYNLPISNLEQHLPGGSVLTRVKPGTTFGFGMGFAYALSYAITTSVSFQESISAGTRLSFENGLERVTGTQTSGMLNLGMGYRVSPKTTINTSVGIGLTANSPNFTLDFSMPLSF